MLARMLPTSLRRAWAHRKLRRGQCAWCEGVLPDVGPWDERTRTCSPECRDEFDLFMQV